MTRDEGFSRGMGGAMIAGGGVHLISGIIFTIRSQRGTEPATPPESFREGDPLDRELEDAEHRSELFLAYLLSDTSVISGAITTARVGIAKDKPTTQGVGLGLASQGVLTLILDRTHQTQGSADLRTPRDLQLQVRVERARSGDGALATVAWVLRRREHPLRMRRSARIAVTREALGSLKDRARSAEAADCTSRPRAAGTPRAA